MRASLPFLRDMVTVCVCVDPLGLYVVSFKGAS